MLLPILAELSLYRLVFSSLPENVAVTLLNFSSREMQGSGKKACEEKRFGDRLAPYERNIIQVRVGFVCGWSACGYVQMAPWATATLGATEVISETPARSRALAR